jgi:hypothetical protein
LIAGAGEASVATVAKVELKSSYSLLCGGWYIETADTKWQALPSEEVEKKNPDLSRVKLGESRFVLQ